MIYADLIGIAPQVNGPIVALNVEDNQAVQEVDLLFVIDPLTYQVNLERAKAQQHAASAARRWR